MRSLLLNSLVLFILIGCSLKIHKDLQPLGNDQTSLNPLFSNNTKSYLYKAAIEYNDKYYSGLLFIKPLADNTYRLVFTNELGMKFFDLEFTRKKMIVHNIIDFPFQKLVLKALEKDLRLLLMNHLNDLKMERLKNTEGLPVFKFKRNKLSTFYFLNPNNEIEKIELTSNKRLKVEVDINNFQKSIPQTIHLKHHNVKFNLKLDYLER